MWLYTLESWAWNTHPTGSIIEDEREDGARLAQAGARDVTHWAPEHASLVEVRHAGRRGLGRWNDINMSVRRETMASLKSNALAVAKRHVLI